MTHFVGLVVANSQNKIEHLLAPYSEHLEVPPWFKPMTPEDVQLMAKYYKFDVSDLDAIDRHMNEWSGHFCTFQDDQPGYMTTDNPNGQWDWYVVGGRWDGEVPHTRCLAENVARYFTEYFPSVLVDEDGWHEEKSWGWWGTWSEPEKKASIKALLEKHRGRTVYVVDFHV
jgi:hypothetical protein